MMLTLRPNCYTVYIIVLNDTGQIRTRQLGEYDQLSVAQIVAQQQHAQRCQNFDEDEESDGDGVEIETEIIQEELGINDTEYVVIVDNKSYFEAHPLNPLYSYQ